MDDSMKHFLYSAIPTIGLALFSPSHAFTLTVGLSFGKEMGDWTNYGAKMGLKKFAPLAMSDLFYDALGIGAGMLVAMVIREIIGGLK